MVEKRGEATRKLLNCPGTLSRLYLRRQPVGTPVAHNLTLLVNLRTLHSIA
jgi:hypothetical protein